MILSYLQSDRYESGYFHKIWVEYFCLAKNEASETFCSKFIRCQSPYQLKNLKTLLTVCGHRNLHGQNFWNLNFFYLKSQSYRYYHEKNQVGCISPSYINLTGKLLIKPENSPKNRAKRKFFIFWEAVSHFCFRWALCPFQFHSAPRNNAD